MIMQRIDLEKRLTERIDDLRSYAKLLPAGRARALNNKCDALTLLAKKAAAQAMYPQRNLFDARTQEDMAAQHNAKMAVFQAMMGGRRISLENAREFKVSQMHTVICKIRREIEDKNLPWVLCDEWIRKGKGSGRTYKHYWLIPKEVAE